MDKIHYYSNTYITHPNHSIFQHFSNSSDINLVSAHLLSLFVVCIAMILCFIQLLICIYNNIPKIQQQDNMVNVSSGNIIENSNENYDSEENYEPPEQLSLETNTQISKPKVIDTIIINSDNEVDDLPSYSEVFTQ
jgi:predicted PurR-regulated permease PerM